MRGAGAQPEIAAVSSQLPADHHRPFGGDRFGILAERFARFFGTPRFIIGQTFIVALWITLNALALTNTIAWDRYPFIALNLLFSLQAAYAAPLILLAQTRQADRDHVHDEALQKHREVEAKRVQRYERGQALMLDQDKQLAEQHAHMLDQNTQITREVERLTKEVHAALCSGAAAGGDGSEGAKGSTGSGPAPTASPGRGSRPTPDA
jgi:uncharacterized membrane protein